MERGRLFLTPSLSLRTHHFNGNRNRYDDGKFEYRHVILPKNITALVPRDRLMSEEEVRALCYLLVSFESPIPSVSLSLSLSLPSAGLARKRPRVVPWWDR